MHITEQQGCKFCALVRIHVPLDRKFTERICVKLFLQITSRLWSWLLIFQYKFYPSLKWDSIDILNKGLSCESHVTYNGRMSV
jgi:hypothetical protein